MVYDSKYMVILYHTPVNTGRSLHPNYLSEGDKNVSLRR